MPLDRGIEEKTWGERNRHMIILGIDTSTASTSVAVSIDGETVCEITANHRQTHSEQLMHLVDEVLKMSSLTLSEIDCFACVNGPGSFTGLRIGAASVKGMAQFEGKSIVGVSLLEVLAYGAGAFQGLICPMVDAQRDQVYAGFYKWEDGRLESVKKDMVAGIKEATSFALSFDLPVAFTGDGIKKLGEMPEQKDGDFTILKAPYRIPKAGMLCYAAWEKAMKKENIYTWEEFEPDYFRKSQAEIQMDKKRDEKNEQV